MMRPSEVTNPERVALLLSMFSEQSQDGIVNAIANSPAAVRDRLADIRSSAAPPTPILSVADRASLPLLADLLNGLAAAISADMAMTAFDASRARKVLQFLGIPESELGYTDDTMKRLLENKNIQMMRAISQTLGKAEVKPGGPYAFFLLLGGALTKAQRLLSVMEVPVVSTALARAGQGDIASGDNEIGDALMIDASRELAESTGLPIPLPAGDLLGPETGAVPLVMAASATPGVIRGVGRIFSRRRRRRRAAAQALQHPAVEKQILESSYSDEPDEKAAAEQAARDMDSFTSTPRRPLPSDEGAFPPDEALTPGDQELESA